MAFRTVGPDQYYQHTYRDVDGNVRTRYYGSGPTAQRFARRYHRSRDLRVELRNKAQAERELIATIERRVIEHCQGVDRLFAAWMLLLGWRRHHGQWRKYWIITRQTVMATDPTMLDEKAEAEQFAWWLSKGSFDGMIMRYSADVANHVLDTLISQITYDL
jgi:hypothetical protein